MAIEVNTNSYVTEAELTTYATDRGLTITGDTSVLLIKAMDYIESRDYISHKTDSTQSLQFPRVLCDDYDTNCAYVNDVVPTQIKTAQMVAALLIDNGYTLEDVATQTVKREKVDVLEVEYMDSSQSLNSYTQLNNLLRPFLNSWIKGQRI